MSSEKYNVYLLQRVLRDFKYDVVIWMDSSIRLHTPGDTFVEEAVKRGGIYMPSATSIPGFVVTHPVLYQYLPPYNLEAEKKNRQKEGGFLVVFNTETIYWRIMHWLYLCALDETCQTPPGHQMECMRSNLKNCIRDSTAICWANCHRYDQSNMNILYNNYLYGLNQSALILPKGSGGFSVKRNPTTKYPLKVCS